MANDCRSSNLKCTNCNKKGHVAKVCIQSLLNKKSTYTKHSTNAIQENKTYSVQEDKVVQEYGIKYIVDIYANKTSVSRDIEHYLAYVNIEGKPVRFEVDSGSGYTFLPRDQFAKLNINIPLEPTSIGFRSYTKNVFAPDGKVKVNVSYKGKEIQEEIYIVPENYTALLGRKWIRRLNINLNELDQQHATVYSTQLTANVNNDEFISKYPDVFEEIIGCVPGFKVSLKLRDKATPIFHREREVPYALTKQVEKELESLEAQGIISKIETSDWGSPLVIVPKTDGNVRLCVDYKIGVNERLVSAHYPIRKIDDILNSLRNSRFFCRLDLFKAYLHIPVDDESSIIQTMTTHRGTYRMHRLSFGIKTAPSEFNRIIDQILRDIPKTESYFDDIIVHGTTREECSENLHACLSQLQKFNLHLNRRKCSLFQEKLDFLGHTIEFNKISKSPDKTKAIMEMPKPQSIDDVRRFLGLVTYYARFIPQASTITAPLRKLLKKNAKFRWTAECELSFKQLKQEIGSDQVLMPFNPALPIQLACDASPVGVAGILSHIVGDQERPIAFASRALTPAEQNYSQLDREALAIVYSVDHFFQYLYGRPFKLITDNQPLVRIFHENSSLPRMTTARLQRYAAYLSGFNYSVVFKKGTENTNVDCFSRAPITIKAIKTIDAAINEEVRVLCESSVHQISTTDLTFKTIKEETRNDEFLSEIFKKLRSGEDSDFTIEGDILFRGHRVVVPAALQEAVLKELHRTHIGITKMKQLARRYVYWKSIDKDIEHMVRACTACATTKSSPVKAPLHPWIEPEENWQRIHIDYAGPYQDYYFLVVIDAKSKWAEIEPCKQAPTSTSTIELLQDIFARHGFPDVMVSDNATIFTSETFQKFCAEGGIIQKYIAPGHPSTNGLAERNIQTLKHRLAAMIDEPLSMHQKVREVLFRYRATPLNNGKTPAELYLHRNIRIKLDALKPLKQGSPTSILSKVRHLSVGERVLARYYADNKLQWKLGVIMEKLGKLHYRVKLDNGYIFKRHIDQLRSSEIATPPKKSVSFSPANSDQNNDDPDSNQSHHQLNMEDLVYFSPNNQPREHHQAPHQQEYSRPSRNRRPPTHLQDYVTF